MRAQGKTQLLILKDEYLFYIRNAHSPSYIVFLNLMFIHMPCNLQESYLCTSILQFKLAISEAKSAISSSTNEITEEDTSSSISIPGTTPTWTIAEASEHTDKQSSYQQNKLLPVQSKQRLAPGLYYKKKEPARRRDFRVKFISTKKNC